MKRILVLYAHPAQHHSRVNAAMASRVATLENISLVDLYAEYPRFKIDVDREQQRLLEHDIIVMQFPLMWYSTPSLLKEWQDLVLEYGFGYGPGGDKLKGKTLALAVSAGSSRESYQSDGLQNYELQYLLRPLEQMARLCQMQTLPPYVLFSSLDAAESPRMEKHLNTYCRYLCALRDGHLGPAQLSSYPLVEAEHLSQLLEQAHD